MFDELAIYEKDLSPPLSRGAERATRKIRRKVAGATDHIAAVEFVQVAKANAIGRTSRVALLQCALVSQSEQSLAMVVPAASGRLATIADVASLGLTEVVADTVRRVLR